MPKDATNQQSPIDLRLSGEPAKIVPIKSDVIKDIPYTYNDYLPADESTSAFAALKLHEKRAVQTEANIQLLGYRKSEQYGARAQDPQTAYQILGYYCEKYAADPRRVRELVNAENDAEKRFIGQHRPQNALNAYYQKCSHGVAKRLDTYYSAEHDKIKQIKNIMPEGNLSHSFRTIQINTGLLNVAAKEKAGPQK